MNQFKKIVKRYVRVGYNLDIMRQSACLVLNPITVYSYGFLFNCTFCCTLPYVHSSIAIILMGKRDLVALLNLSSRCLVMFERFFLAVPRGCLWLVVVVFPDETHLLF